MMTETISKFSPSDMQDPLHSLVTFPSSGSSLPFILSLPVNSNNIVHAPSQSPTKATCNTSIPGAGGFGALHIDIDAFKGVSIRNMCNDAILFHRSCSTSMLGGDFSRGVIIVDSETWGAAEWR